MKISFYLNKFNIILLSLFFLCFPFIVTNLSTDAYTLPKQTVLAAISLIGLLSLALRFLAEKKVVLRRTPFDLPILIFTLVLFVSAFFSQNRADSLVASTGILFAVVLYFLVSNFVKEKREVFILLGSFILGNFLLALFYLLTFFKVYLLPFDFTRSQTFTPFGALLDQGIYLLTGLAFAFFFLKSLRKTKITKEQRNSPKFIAMSAGAILGTAGLLLGFGATLYALLKLANPIILPFATGFQLAFASISQDTQRWALSFFLGSGPGTFSTDFTRFKLADFNQTPFWNLTFFRSSTFVFELLATAGVLGLLSYLYLLFKILRKKPLFQPLFLLIVISFLLPFSTSIIILFFMVLSIFAGLEALTNTKEYYDLELGLVTLRNGLLAVSPSEGKEVRRGLTGILNFVVFLLLLALVVVLGFFSYKYVLANYAMQKSLLSQNNATLVYQLQTEAVTQAGFVDGYQRVYSQTNLNISNSILREANKSSSPSAQQQQTVYTLIQQSISAARYATVFAPNTAANFQNLSSVYRSLLGFGKDADKFAEAAQKQAVNLDPTNPQQYIALGGLYYQLKDFSKAEEQFRLAVSLKPNFANSHYNLAYTLKEMGRTSEALSEFETVKELVKNQQDNLKKVEADINLVKQGLSTREAPAAKTNPQLPPQESPLPLASPTPYSKPQQ